MPIKRARVVWAVFTVLLLIVIIGSVVYIWMHWPRRHLIEISMASPVVVSSWIYLDGSVTNPGCYAVKDGESLVTLLQAAGGITDNADLNNVRLYVPALEDTEQAQKVNINRAENWLLEALPGIGTTLSLRIIEYRQQHGLFRNTGELTNIDGISLSLYEKIKPLITVTD